MLIALYMEAQDSFCPAVHVFAHPMLVLTLPCPEVFCCACLWLHQGCLVHAALLRSVMICFAVVMTCSSSSCITVAPDKAPQGLTHMCKPRLAGKWRSKGI